MYFSVTIFKTDYYFLDLIKSRNESQFVSYNNGKHDNIHQDAETLSITKEASTWMS